MEIILLERVPKLGNLGDKVKVRPGYGRNFLIPRKKGLPANEANLKEFEARRAKLQEAEQLRLQEVRADALRLEGLKLTIKVRAGEEGKLFGSVGVHEIVQAVLEQGHTIEKSAVKLPNGPIRQVGEYEIELQLLGDEVTAKLLLSIIAI